jgi:hypothetical protein
VVPSDLIWMGHHVTNGVVEPKFYTR